MNNQIIDWLNIVSDDDIFESSSGDEVKRKRMCKPCLRDCRKMFGDSLEPKQN